MAISLLRGHNQPPADKLDGKHGALSAIPAPVQETWCQANGIPDDTRSAVGYGTKFKPEEPGSIADRWQRAIRAYLSDEGNLNSRTLHEILGYRGVLGPETYKIGPSGSKPGNGFFKKSKVWTEGDVATGTIREV